MTNQNEEQIPLHYFLASIDVGYIRKNKKNEIVGTDVAKLNVVAGLNDNRINHQAIESFQRQAVESFTKQVSEALIVEKSTLDIANIHINNIVYLGNMTSEEYAANNITLQA